MPVCEISESISGDLRETLVLAEREGQDTFTVKMQPGLSIVYYQEIIIPKPVSFSEA